MCVHPPVQCSFLWYIMLIRTSHGMRFAHLFHLFLDTRWCSNTCVSHSHSQRESPAPCPRSACVSFFDRRWHHYTSITGSRVSSRCFADTLSNALKHTMGHIHTNGHVHRTCAQCVCTVGSCVGAYSSKFCWHVYHTSLLLWWHLFYCHDAYGLFEARFYFVCCLDNSTSSHHASFLDIYIVTHFLWQAPNVSTPGSHFILCVYVCCIFS